MKMTENMKRSVVESFQKKGLELSEEQLEAVTGGRDLTRNECAAGFNAGREVRRYADKGGRVERLYNELASQYIGYIASLPEGSPEVLFQDTEFYKKLWEGETKSPSDSKFI